MSRVIKDSAYNFGHGCDLDKVGHNQAQDSSDKILDFVDLEWMALSRVLWLLIREADQPVYVDEEAASQVLRCLVSRSSLEILLDKPFDCAPMLIRQTWLIHQTPKIRLTLRTASRSRLLGRSGLMATLT